MLVEINNEESVLLSSSSRITFGSDEDSDIFIKDQNNDKSHLFSIVNHKGTYILEVQSSDGISVNDMPVKEKFILNAGDIIKHEDQSVKIIDENKKPPKCKEPFKLVNNKELKNHLLTSVSGIRSFNPDTIGELTVIGDKNISTFTTESTDIPFSVSYVKDKLTLLCKKDNYVYVNGNKANYVNLKNGDFITTKNNKFCVESPGNSAFIKYNDDPQSHSNQPEDFNHHSDFIDIGQKKSFVKNNLWWITLVGGLLMIFVLLMVLKNLN